MMVNKITVIGSCCEKLSNPPPDEGYIKIDCPKCKKKMWLSGKAKGRLLFNAVLGMDIFLRCEECI